MVTDILTPVAASTDAVATRPLGVCGYVERGLPEVVERLSAPGAATQVASALAPTLHAGAGDIVVDLRGPVLVSDRVAHLHLAWAAADGRNGRFKLSVLAVRSGRDALTELLVSVPVDETTAVGTAVAARHFLDELALVLHAPE
jgi:hypothetical protein